MHRTNIPVEGDLINHPTGLALGLLVHGAIENMQWVDHYRIVKVTPYLTEVAVGGHRPHIELTYDDDATNQQRDIAMPEGHKPQGTTRVRIYEGPHAGWCDIQFINGSGEVVYEKKNVLPFYTGMLVGMITEFLLGAKVWLDMEPKPFRDDRPEGTGAGWFLQEGRPEHVYDTPQEAWEKDTRTPTFFLRLEQAAKDMNLPEAATYFKYIHAQLESMGYRGAPTPHPGELTVNIVNGKRAGSRKWNEDEIKGVMIEQAIDAGFLRRDLLTPEQLYYHAIYLMQRAYWLAATKAEREAEKS